MFEPISNEAEQLVAQVMDAAFKVHRTLGPGLLESVYESCLCYELTKQKIPFQRQLSLPVMYDGVRIDAGLRLDLFVQNMVIVELKATEKMNPLYEAQLLTYLKLTGNRIGLLINFNVPMLKDGFKRMVL